MSYPLQILEKGVKVDREWDVAMYLSRKEFGLTLKEIAGMFCIRANTTVSMARGRVESRLEKHRSFRQRVEGLLRFLRGSYQRDCRR